LAEKVTNATRGDVVGFSRAVNVTVLLPNADAGDTVSQLWLLDAVQDTFALTSIVFLLLAKA
jgi:hypothetical protein